MDDREDESTRRRGRWRAMMKHWARRPAADRRPHPTLRSSWYQPPKDRAAPLGILPPPEGPGQIAVEVEEGEQLGIGDIGQQGQLELVSAGDAAVVAACCLFLLGEQERPALTELVANEDVA